MVDGGYFVKHSFFFKKQYLLSWALNFAQGDAEILQLPRTEKMDMKFE